MSVAAPKQNPLHSLIAGATAGVVEGFATYPTEFVKTQSQFAVAAGSKPPGPIEIVKTTLKTNGVKGLYAGCGALVVGNAFKSGVRFLSYDSIKMAVADKETGRLTLPRSIAAGFLAGLCEGALAVTPSEAIKTRLIEDGRRPKAERQYKGLFSGAAQIVRTEGIGAIYRGLGPTMMRQGANSAVRLTTYSTLKAHFVKDNTKPGTLLTFALGAIAGTVTVYCTMPFDVVKTRMQSASASRYKGAFDCVATVFREEGLLRFWKGTTPRLTRLVLAGGITFTVYEKTLTLLDVAVNKTKEIKEVVAEKS